MLWKGMWNLVGSQPIFVRSVVRRMEDGWRNELNVHVKASAATPVTMSNNEIVMERLLIFNSAPS